MSIIKYTYHKYENIEKKYSRVIELILQNDSDFIEDNSDNIVDWSDKNNKSRIKDFYIFTKISIIDKKYLPLLLPDIIPNTYINGDFKKFIKKSQSTVFFLKSINSNNILISKNPYTLYNKFIENRYIIQEEVKPMLINGYKFDIKTYVLIVYNKNYIHIYYNYGIIRYCKKLYIDGTTDIDRQLTESGNIEYIDNKFNKYFTGIKDIIYKSLINLKIINGIGYQYLGYNILISDTEKLYLLGINRQPSLSQINYNIDILQNFTKLVVKPLLTTNLGYRPFISINNNIKLVEPNISHLEDLYNITRNENIMKYIGNLKVWSYDKTRAFIEYGPSENYYYKAILYKNKLQGIIGIYKNNTSYYNLVIFINNIGKGIGTKALSLFLLTVDNSPIFADVLNTNIRSINFFKKWYNFTIMNNIHKFTIK